MSKKSQHRKNLSEFFLKEQAQKVFIGKKIYLDLLFLFDLLIYVAVDVFSHLMFVAVFFKIIYYSFLYRFHRNHFSTFWANFVFVVFLINLHNLKRIACLLQVRDILAAASNPFCVNKSAHSLNFVVHQEKMWYTSKPSICFSTLIFSILFFASLDLLYLAY